MDEEQGLFDYKLPTFKAMDEEQGLFDYKLPTFKAMDEEELVELQGNVVDFARSKVGSPYQFGGSSFKTGIDCSSFVGQSFKQVGVTLPRTSSQIAQVGTPVNGGRANWKPGDILNYPGHVGIYAGNNKIIHAAGANKGVVEGTVWGTPSVRRILH